MIKFTQYGYSPDNFRKLVKSSGLTNKAFYEENGMSKSMFYEYQNGSTSMTWQDWKKLVSKQGGDVNVKE